jgi:hypothetical protein
VTSDWLLRIVAERARRVPGFIAPEFRESALVPLAERASGWLGLQPPLWQHTARVRRLLSHMSF